jgi:hypothetical protein
MAQVPYSPVPDVSPDAAPLRPLHEEVNAQMFGAGVGEAISSLGHDFTQAGNEVFSTAVKFKQLDIENEVNKATTDYFNQSGDLDTKFRMQEGDAPKNTLEQHKNSLIGLREGIRDSLSSDYARKAFDRETMRRMGYDIVNAGSYAAGQFKTYTKNTRQATIDETINTMLRDPNNAGAIDDGLAKITQLTAQDSVDSGDSQPLLKAKTQVALGRAVESIAKTKAKTDPDGAQAFLKKYEGYVGSAQYQAALGAVQERGVRVNAEREAARIATPMDAIIERARGVTKEQESGGNYSNVTTTVNKRTGQSQSALGAYGVMENNLAEWSKEVLGRTVSKEEFLKNPEIQDQIYNTKMGQYIQRYGVEGAGRAWLGGEGAVNAPERRDALGTSVGDYGRVFATKVGSVQPRDLNERSVADMMGAAEESANRLYPNDATMRQQYLDQLQHGILAKSSIQKKELNDRQRSLTNSIQETLNAKMQNGRGPTSFTEAGQVDAAFQDKYDELVRLNPQYAGRLQQAFIKNAKQDVPNTQERQDNYTRYIGMADPDFAQQDFNKAFNNGEITLTHANQLGERQAMMKKKAFENLHADSILRENGALLNDAQIFRSTNNTSANQKFDHFRGSLITKLEAYVEEHKAPMPRKESDELVKGLLKDVVTSKGYIWGTYSKPEYEAIYSAPTITDTKAYNDLPAGAYYKSRDGTPRRKPDATP